MDNFDFLAYASSLVIRRYNIDYPVFDEYASLSTTLWAILGLNAN
jgi:hypothetical protein